eukprot:CAMPEP_0113638836 /NCGR_PEP_ID=MMETSP0017_2-20120614/20359_1 /TAXON_ID=2856 /ORGANISM="Cylindrotheca closterium" /LENGTH=230 /DNA_ID=CAMNT_0000549991 /DNA_START=2013 /DNA_END=2705 /DNA_ORIENTATION=- /assembly_acc=CAM_ASM_000147
MLSSITRRFKPRAHRSKESAKKQKVDQTKSVETLFEHLPRELKQRVAFFLPLCDLMNLAKTSQSMRSDLDLEIVSSPLTDRASQNKLYQTSFQRKCFAVVVPKPEARLHSMTFTCLVRCDRYKGRVFIVEQDVPADQNPENLKRRFASSVEFKLATLDSDQRGLALTFPVKPNKMYQFYVLTQGMGRSIRFLNMCLDRVGFGHKSTECISYQFDAFEEDYFEGYDVGLSR